MNKTNEWFVVTNSFAAPFCSDTQHRYVEAATAADALAKVADEYRHPAGLFSAAAWPSADAKEKGAAAEATWLCNHEIELQRLTEGMASYSYCGYGPGDFEIDGVRHKIDNPKGGRVFPATQEAE
jgi:hypothetical protein